MKAYNIGDLKNNPSSAIKDSKEGPVIVLNRNNPEAIIFSLDFIDDPEDLLKSLAIQLYKEGSISLGKAAKVAKLSYNDFIELLSNHRIPVIRYGVEDVNEDLKTGRKWLKENQ